MAYGSVNGSVESRSIWSGSAMPWAAAIDVGTSIRNTSCSLLWYKMGEVAEAVEVNVVPLGQTLRM